MNVLIFEYITGGGMIGEPLPASLVKEGELMLKAVASDFVAIQGVEVSVLRDYRLHKSTQNVQEINVGLESSYDEVIEKLANKIDAMLIIAPETGNTLFSLCAKYSQCDFILLNCDPECIALATDKYQTYLFLEKHAINQVPTYLLNEIHKITTGKVIAKPKDGVGCENIVLAENSHHIHDQNIPNEYIFQPYIQGQHLSLSLLCWGKECSLLSVNQQRLVEKNNTLVLEGCIVNETPRESFNEFSKKLISSFTGLKGYIGVDLVVAGDELYFIEINPRLTTSYAGIRSALDINPAQLVLQTFLDGQLATFKQNKNSSVVVNIGDMCAA